MEKTLIEKVGVERFLALSNLSKKRYRTASISLLVALSSALAFASLVIDSNMKAGIEGLKARTGADLLIVPEGYETGAENVLLSGEPCYFYMDKSVLDTARSVEGVEKASPQFYLTSLSESCCDFPMQIIGFDRESDFTVQNWAGKSLNPDADGKILLAGSGVTTEKGRIKIFGTERTITSKLSKSGTGMDNGLFCDMETLKDIFDDAKKKGFSFISDGDTESKISTVLVKLSEGSSADGTALRIKAAVPGVQVIQGDKFVRTFSERLSSFRVFSAATAAAVFVLTFLTLATSFSATINERRREFSILRVLGANRRSLSSVLLSEAAILGAAGSALGVAAAALAVIPFETLIAEKLSMPFVSSGIGSTALIAAIVVAAGTAAALGAALNGALRLSRVEPYGDVK